MRNPGLATSLRYRATRLRARLGLASLWAADRLEALADTVAVGLLRAEAAGLLRPGAPVWHDPKDTDSVRIYKQVQHDYARLNGGVGILRPVVPPRRSPNGLARRNDHLAIRAIAEHRPRASILTVETVLLEFRERGVCVSIAEAELIGRRVAAAATYRPSREVADARD